MARYLCPACGYVYDEAVGDEHEGFPAGTPWSDVPDDFFCPDCGVRFKEDFEKNSGADLGEDLGATG